MERDGGNAREQQWGAALGQSNGSSVATEHRPDAPTTTLPDLRWGRDDRHPAGPGSAAGEPYRTNATADTTALRWDDPSARDIGYVAPAARSTTGYDDDAAGDPMRLRDGADDSISAGVPKRGRPGLVVAVAFLLELVLIAAGANQAVMRHVLHVAHDQASTIQGSLAQAASIFAWRVGPATGARDLWYGQFATIGGILVLGALLTVAVVRGSASWGRVFFGTWLAVTVATVLAHVGGLITARPYYLAPGSTQVRYLPTGHHAGLVRLPATRQALYAAFDPSVAYAVVAGLGLGLIVAFVVSIVAVSTRRAVEPAAVEPVTTTETYAPEAPPPYYGDTTTLPAAPPAAPAGPMGSVPPVAPPWAGELHPSHPYAAYAPDSDTRDTGDTVPSGDTVQSGDTVRTGDTVRSGSAAEHATTTLPTVADEPHDETSAVGAGRPEANENDAAERPEPAGQPHRVARTWPPRQPTNRQAAAQGPSESASADDQRTKAFPLPPDDEDLDHAVDPD